VLNTRVKLTGHAPKFNRDDDAVARRGNGNDRAAARNGGYERTTDDDDANNAQAQQPTYQTRGGDDQYNTRQYDYQERPYYGRSLFFPNGW